MVLTSCCPRHRRAQSVSVFLGVGNMGARERRPFDVVVAIAVGFDVGCCLSFALLAPPKLIVGALSGKCGHSYCSTGLCTRFDICFFFNTRTRYEQGAAWAIWVRYYDIGLCNFCLLPFQRHDLAPSPHRPLTGNVAVAFTGFSKTHMLVLVYPFTMNYWCMWALGVPLLLNIGDFLPFFAVSGVFRCFVAPPSSVWVGSKKPHFRRTLNLEEPVVSNIRPIFCTCGSSG